MRSRVLITVVTLFTVELIGAAVSAEPPGNDLTRILRAQLKRLEQQTDAKARELRKLAAACTDAHPRITSGKTELQASVEQGFETQQELYRAELAELYERAKNLEQHLAARESLKETIVRRRMEELLNPALRWNAGSEFHEKPEATPEPAQAAFPFLRSLPFPASPAATYAGMHPIKPPYDAPIQVVIFSPQGATCTYTLESTHTETSLPARFNVAAGTTVPMTFSKIPGREGLELTATLQVALYTRETYLYLRDNAIPLRITDEDLDRVSSHQAVVKLVSFVAGAAGEMPTCKVDTLHMAGDHYPARDGDREREEMATLRLTARSSEKPATATPE